MGERSLFALDGRRHLSRRKLLLPAFHGAALARARELVRQIAEGEVDSWPVGRPIKLAEAMEAIALDVVFRAVFGVSDAERLERLRRELGPVITPGLVTQAAWIVPVLMRAEAVVTKRVGPTTRSRRPDGLREG